MSCLHHLALSWFLQWLGFKSARQHSAKQTGLEASTGHPTGTPIQRQGWLREAMRH